MSESDDIPELVPAESPQNLALLLSQMKSIPITILTGFLGAGKSTLLGRILTEAHGMKIAVIMNEIGDSGGVDKATLFEKNANVGEEWLEVENGCLCCTAKSEALLALQSLFMRRPDIDHIIIEASGAADPSRLIKDLWVEEGMASIIELDGIVCVVDGTTVEALLTPTSPKYSIEAARQVAIADLILLNKVDCLQAQGTHTNPLRQLLQGINPLAKLVETSFSQVPISTIFDLGEYTTQRMKSTNQTKGDMVANLLERISEISFGDNSVHGQAQVAIRSFTIASGKACKRDAFDRWLFTLLWEKRITDAQFQELSPLTGDDTILRIKGIIMIKDAQGRISPHALQVVQEQYELEPLSRVEKPLDASHLIFIGRFTKETESLIKSSLQEHFIHSLS